MFFCSKANWDLKSSRNIYSLRWAQQRGVRTGHQPGAYHTRHTVIPGLFFFFFSLSPPRLRSSYAELRTWASSTDVIHPFNPTYTSLWWKEKLESAGKKKGKPAGKLSVNVRVLTRPRGSSFGICVSLVQPPFTFEALLRIPPLIDSHSHTCTIVRYWPKARMNPRKISMKLNFSTFTEYL
jgi:hypothetical protein